ncbi:MAG: hypothetical protein QXM98_06485, partial [Thermoproteota archaeon]
VEHDNDLLSFGLQKAGGDLYELDVDKVLRIVNVGDYQLPSTIKINYSRIAELLGLGNEYGFSIRVRPALNVSIFPSGMYEFNKGGSKKQDVVSSVDVMVRTLEGRPAIGANVTGLYVFMHVRNKGNKDYVYMNHTYMTSVTGPDGKATIDFQEYIKDLENKIREEEDLKLGWFKKAIPAIVVFAEYYGIRAVNSTVIGSSGDIPLKGAIVNNYVIVDYSIDIDEFYEGPHGAAHVKNATGLVNPPYYVYIGSLNNTRGESDEVINPGAKKHRVYEITSVVIDDETTFIILPFKKEGEGKVIAIFRPPSDSSCQLGLASGNIKTSIVRRMVKMGSFHYIAEVMVWRWGER